MLINRFSEKNSHLGKWAILDPNISIILENFISCFLKKKFIWGNMTFLGHFFSVWLGMVEIESGHCCYWILDQDMIFFSWWLLDSQDMMIKIHKRSRHDFSGNIYVIDIVWISCDVYVCRSKFNIGLLNVKVLEY